MEVQMEETENNTSSPVPSSGIQNFDYPNHVESGSEIQDLLQKLGSWSEQRRASQNQLDNLLSSYSGRVDKGMGALVEELRDLKVQLSVLTEETNDLKETNKKLGIDIKEKDKFQEDLTGEVTGLHLKLSEVTKERNYMQETVHKLNEEIRVQKNRFSQVKALLVTNEDWSVEPQDKEFQDVQNRTTKQSKILQHHEGYSDIGSSINDWDELSLAEAMATTVVERTTDEKVTDTNLSQEENIGMIENGESGEETITECDEVTVKVDKIEDHAAETNLSEVENKAHVDEGVPTYQTFTSSGKVLIPFTKSSKGSLRNQAVAKKEARWHFCPECGHVTNTINNLNLHMKSVHKKEDKAFKCEKCTYASNDKGDLKKHVEKRHEPKNIICTDCGSAFSRNCYLKIHIKNVHTHRGKFICDKCPFASGIRASLKAHKQRVHEKIRNHACEGCGYSTYNEKDLRKHIKAVHANIRDQDCKICGKSFSQKTHLTTHIKRAHKNIKDHFCGLCDYASKDRETLNQHMVSIHDMEEEPLICGRCNFNTSSKAELRRHVLQECAKTKVNCPK